MGTLSARGPERRSISHSNGLNPAGSNPARAGPARGREWLLPAVGSAGIRATSGIEPAAGRLQRPARLWRERWLKGSRSAGTPFAADRGSPRGRSRFVLPNPLRQKQPNFRRRRAVRSAGRRKQTCPIGAAGRPASGSGPLRCKHRPSATARRATAFSGRPAGRPFPLWRGYRRRRAWSPCPCR